MDLQSTTAPATSHELHYAPASDNPWPTILRRLALVGLVLHAAILVRGVAQASTLPGFRGGAGLRQWAASWASLSLLAMLLLPLVAAAAMAAACAFTLVRRGRTRRPMVAASALVVAVTVAQMALTIATVMGRSSLMGAGFSGGLGGMVPLFTWLAACVEQTAFPAIALLLLLHRRARTAIEGPA